MTIFTICRRCHEPIETVNGDLCLACAQPYDRHSLAECVHAEVLEVLDGDIVCLQAVPIARSKSVLAKRILAGERGFRPVACIGCRQFRQRRKGNYDK